MERTGEGLQGESSSLGCGKGELLDTDEMSDVESQIRGTQERSVLSIKI